MYLNDLPEYIESIVHLFADDTVLYLTINTQDNYLHIADHYLNNLEVWEKQVADEY